MGRESRVYRPERDSLKRMLLTECDRRGARRFARWRLAHPRLSIAFLLLAWPAYAIGANLAEWTINYDILAALIEQQKGRP